MVEILPPMTPKERATLNVSLNREWNSDEDIRAKIEDQICAAVDDERDRIISILKSYADKDQNVLRAITKLVETLEAAE